MNRRNFLTAIFGTVSGASLAQSVEINPNKQKFWEEFDFEFEGIPGTCFIWPKDRIISVKSKGEYAIGVPSFSMKSLNSSLSDQMKMALNVWPKTAPCHLHCFVIRDNPDFVGVCIGSERYIPCEDFHTQEAYSY